MKNTPNENRELQIMGPSRDFESIKKIDENGVEYWLARELVYVLGYSKWQHFEEVINKAKQACVNSRQFPQDHFTDTGKLTQIGHGIVRKLDDYKLDRFACYLIAQNGDSSKPAIAMAQTYFAIQTRKQEILDNLSETEKRIMKQQEVSDRNKLLFSTAKLAGVSNFGLFNDAGYRGLYTMPLKDIENMKGIPKGELLDRAGGEELAANLFRITQTEAKLHRENIKGDLESQRTHFEIGGKVRKAIKDMGGEMPENLKAEKHIREARREVKMITRGGNKLKLT
ncbi:MAG: DNA damage-inducible protein D [Candidatus Taylorbacteria bacterium]|nr:DNA damage-inducible protein D [Candidatus Taylorbacteria bacterium]